MIDIDESKAEAVINAAQSSVDAKLCRKDIFKSLPIAEFNALPKLSPEDFQKSLDAGRPSPPVGGGWNPRGFW